MPVLGWTIIGNPENRRTEYFRAALAAAGVPTEMVSYEDVLLHSRQWADRVTMPYVRLDSPGENPVVAELLMARGQEVLKSCSIRPAAFGEIVQSREWYAGFADCLRDIESELTPRPVEFISAPAEIACMFDKPRTQTLLATAGLPVPRFLGAIHDYGHLRHRMQDADLRRVFVKLQTGSSASGVIAFEAAPAACRAITSVEIVEGTGETQLFNSLRVRTYRQEATIARLINRLCVEGVYVEEWIPKAGFQGLTCDLRIVILAGRPAHCVVRSSRHPLTNLHLGNRRGDTEAFRSAVPQAAWRALEETCCHIGNLFPHSLCFGVDVAFTPGLKRHFVLESNAFGNLLPGLMHRGRDTYAAEVSAWLGRRTS